MSTLNRQAPAGYRIESANERRRFELSPTLAINEHVAAERGRGRKIIHLGFGEARLPVPDIVAEALRDAVGENAYGPVIGARELRESAAGWMTRRGVPTDAAQVLVTPGSKAALFALLLAMPGDLVLPRPSWVSYAAQGRLVGKGILWCDVPPSAGGIPDPSELAAALGAARRRGLDPRIMILTIPDNPTGTFPTEPLLKEVVEIAREQGLTVIADEIYSDLSFEPGKPPAAAGLAPASTYVTSGLSKCLSLGGWRIGTIRVPDSSDGVKLAHELEAIASEIWSCVPSPIARAARVAFDEPAGVRDYLHAARTTHHTLATSLHERLIRVGLDCRPPTGAFYLYPTFDGRLQVEDDTTLQRELLSEAGIATLPGSSFGDDPARLRLRLATTYLCGDGREQAETLSAAASGQLLQLPHIQRDLDEIEHRLASFLERAR